MLSIVKAPHPVLGQKAKPVQKIDKEILEFIDEMKKTLDATDDPKGIGLAAPQVGKDLQIFIIKQTPKSPFLIFINPKIEQIENPGNENHSHKKSATKLEGCLSIPNIWGEVLRNSNVILSYLDESGKYHKRKFNGFIATIIQHEYDHLNGTLFPKRVLEQNKRLYKSYKNEEGEDIFEEIEI